ncbi:MAG: methyltransferase [Bryobacterales bacterium]|nr:methyltransferase [Bryobacterales bacterium]
MIHVAAKLGIAELLQAGPRSAADLASATATNPEALYRLLRTLSGLGVFVEQPGQKFVLNPAAELLLPGKPGSVRADAIVAGEDFMWKPWGRLIHSVRTGETAFDHLYGKSTWEWFRDNPAEARVFDDFQAEGTRNAAQALTRAYDYSAAKKIVDVGGGSGQLLAAVLAQNPQARGTLFDLPDVVKAAQAHPVPPLDARADFVGGDFFASVPGEGDLYLLKYIIHDWADAKSIEILKSIRKAMPGHAKLLLIEDLICEPNQDCRSKTFDIMMMVRNGGRNRTEAEYRRLLAASGFEVARVIPTASNLFILESVPGK